MLRGILSAVVILSLGILVLLTLVFANNAQDEFRLATRYDLNASKEVVRLANSVNDFSLQYLAEEVARRDDVVHTMGCPKDAADAARRARPEIDPTTGQPVEQEAAADDGNGRVCVDSRHALTLRELREFSQMMTPIWQANSPRFVSDRSIGSTVPRQPDLFLAADANGEVIARVGFDMDSYHGPDRPNLNRFQVVGRVEEMGSQYDVIRWKDYEDSASVELMQVAAAPVFTSAADGTQGEYLGAIVVGYKLNNAQAVDIKDLMNEREDLVYFSQAADGSVVFAGNTLDRDPTFRSTIMQQEFFQLGEENKESKDSSSIADVASQGISENSVYSFEHEGNEYFVSVGSFSLDRANTETPAGFMILTDIGLMNAPMKDLVRIVPIAGIVLALLTVLLIFFVVKVFLQPVGEIGRGVQEVIAGNRDYMWEVDDSYFSDLAHSLNIMSARLQGKPDPDSEDAEGAREWQGMVGQPGSGGGGNQQASNGKKSIVGLGSLRGRSADDREE